MSDHSLIRLESNVLLSPFQANENQVAGVGLCFLNRRIRPSKQMAGTKIGKPGEAERMECLRTLRGGEINSQALVRQHLNGSRFLLAGVCNPFRYVKTD